LPYATTGGVRVIDISDVRSRLSDVTLRVIRLQNELGNVPPGTNEHRSLKKRWQEALADQRILRTMQREASEASRQPKRSGIGAVNTARTFSTAAAAMKLYVGRVNEIYVKWSSGALPETPAECLAELAEALEVEAAS
jgi:hypothetical protein